MTMSKQSMDKTVNQPKQTLSDKVITTVVTSLAKTLRGMLDNAGGLIEWSKGLKAAGLPVEVPEGDVITIADKLAADMGWNERSRAKVDKSEARAVIRAHSRLPEAIAAMRSIHGTCGYHDTVKICRKLKATDGDMKAALALITETREARESDPVKGVESALRKWYNITRDSAKGAKRTKLLQAIQAFATEQGLELKVEL
jgi:hypothetical protein